MFPWQRIKLKNSFSLSLLAFIQTTFQSHGFKNCIIVFHTPNNIKLLNFIKVEQFFFSNDLPQDYWQLIAASQVTSPLPPPPLISLCSIVVDESSRGS